MARKQLFLLTYAHHEEVESRITIFAIGHFTGSDYHCSRRRTPNGDWKEDEYQWCVDEADALAIYDTEEKALAGADILKSLAPVVDAEHRNSLRFDDLLKAVLRGGEDATVLAYPSTVALLLQVALMATQPGRLASYEAEFLDDIKEPLERLAFASAMLEKL